MDLHNIILNFIHEKFGNKFEIYLNTIDHRSGYLIATILSDHVFIYTRQCYDAPWDEPIKLAASDPEFFVKLEAQLGNYTHSAISSVSLIVMSLL